MRRLVAAVAALALPALAHGEGLRDRSSHSPPPLDLPRAGGTYVDPVFGTTILRVTDERDGKLCVHAYATWQALNLDGSRLLLSCDGEGLLYRYDGTTAIPDGKLGGADGPKVEFEGASWSNLEADVIYALDGRRLWKLDVGSRGMAGATVVHDFAGLFPYSFKLAQLSMSGDDRVFAFHSRDSRTGAKLDVAVYDSATGETRVFDRGGIAIDESRIDKSGQWVMVANAGVRAGWRMWDLESGAVTAFDAADPDARASGHADLGWSGYVNGDGWETGLVVRGYDAQRGAANVHNIVRYLRADGKPNWSIADHASLRSEDERFVVASTYAGDGSWAPFEDEIYLAYTDGSGFVRLAHTRSVEAAATREARYWAQPRAVVDRRGRTIVYTSDLGSATRTDVLVLHVPRDLWPAQSDAENDKAGQPAASEHLQGVPAEGCNAGGRRPAGGVGWVLALLAFLVRRSR